MTHLQSNSNTFLTNGHLAWHEHYPESILVRIHVELVDNDAILTPVSWCGRNELRLINPVKMPRDTFLRQQKRLQGENNAFSRWAVEQLGFDLMLPKEQQSAMPF